MRAATHYIGRARRAAAQHRRGDLAVQFLQGIEILALRVDRISDNALKVAQPLARHEKVE
jgi:O-acetylhomoserine (thiol)-lyase